MKRICLTYYGCYYLTPNRAREWTLCSPTLFRFLVRSEAKEARNGLSNVFHQHYFFFPSFVTVSVAQQVSRSHDLRYFPPSHFLFSPDDGAALAPSTRPLSYFTLGNIAPTRKTIRHWGGGPGSKPIGCSRGRSEVLAYNNICIREHPPLFPSDIELDRSLSCSVVISRVLVHHDWLDRLACGLLLTPLNDDFWVCYSRHRNGKKWG